MFLKESLSILAFGSSTLGISGFAIKIDKFEHNFLIKNQLNLSIESYRKLNLKKGDNFYYFENENSRLSKITSIQVIKSEELGEDEYIQISLEPKWKNYEPKDPEIGVIIKYFLESKPFWINLFS